MSPEGTTTRGSIIKVPDATPGILFANGKQQPFTLEGVWKSPVAPAVNMTVDVQTNGAGAIESVTVVDQHQLSKERMNQIGGIAQERGKEAAMLAQQGLGAMVARMGMVPLGTAVLTVIAFFFLPAASVGGGLLGSMSFTFWELLGVDFNDPRTILAGSSHGFFSFIALLMIFVPFAAPFLKVPWARYLYAAPLAAVVIGFISSYMSENKAFGDLAKLTGSSPFSWSWGVFVLMIVALVLGLQAMKAPSQA